MKLPDSKATARVMFPEGDESVRTWVIGMPVHAQGTGVIIGHVLSTGVSEDGRPYAELALTPAALGVGYERPAEGIEEAFG